MIISEAGYEQELRPRKGEASYAESLNEMNKLLKEQTSSKTSKYLKMVREQV